MRLMTSMLLACSLSPLWACSNALYFYETEKISLTAEGRPDSSQPVQGNLGIKQRAALVVPPKHPGSYGGEGDEALSSISSFRFTKDPGGVFNIGPVTIRSALITGEAATSLSPDKQKEAAKALAGVDIQSYEEQVKNAIQRAKDNNQCDELKRLVEKPWGNLTPEEKATLGKITGALEVYNEEFHHAISSQLGGSVCARIALSSWS